VEVVLTGGEGVAFGRTTLAGEDERSTSISFLGFRGAVFFRMLLLGGVLGCGPPACVLELGEDIHDLPSVSGSDTELEISSPYCCSDGSAGVLIDIGIASGFHVDGAFFVELVFDLICPFF
jgi:hypothetical protein